MMTNIDLPINECECKQLRRFYSFVQIVILFGRIEVSFSEFDFILPCLAKNCLDGYSMSDSL